MKKSSSTLALVAFLMFLGVTNGNAQDSTSTKRSFSEWLTKTPWTVGFGGNIIDDGALGETFKALNKYAYYPAMFTADKALKKGWSAQFAFSSTSLNPHNFLAVDFNAKYDFNNLIGDTKWFDPYSVLGLGYTYRDLQPKVAGGGESVVNLNAGLGANFWIKPNFGINGQGLAKFSSNNYLQASVGLVFKIGNCEAPKCEAAPKTQEAQDALQHLRGIINK